MACAYVCVCENVTDIAEKKVLEPSGNHEIAFLRAYQTGEGH